MRKDRANSDGCYPIYFYANINGQVKYFTLNHAIPEKVWNPKKQEVSITFPQWQTINNDLARFRSKAERIRIEADQEGLHINMFEFEKVFRGGSKDLSDVFEFIKNDLEEFRNSYASDTIKMYQSQSKKLKTFRTRLSFTEISPFFWKQYDSYLIKLGNNDNTRWKAFRSLKTFINKAIDSGLLKSDPLRGVKVRKPEGNRQFLTQEELKKLEKLNTGF
ncbi:MAG: phage integrase SAM-like domain-containing protein [Bacteroidales bacterium]|nr:phage integrase SAM-like domain-containing protein [Bacteroidales bacterium]